MLDSHRIGSVRAPALALVALALISCGGGSSELVVARAVGGVVAGLTTDGLTLTNGSETLQIASGASSFTFPTKVAQGSGYSVVVQSQPTTRDQFCTVSRGAGTVETADVSNVSVSCRATEWEVSTVAGSGAPGAVDATGVAATFNQPWGVAADAIGNLYVADRGNNKIRRISASGVVTTLAGSGLVAFADGNGTSAAFNVPQGVAVDGAENVYVADSTNCAIRKISPSGLVTTLAGSPGVCGQLDGSGAAATFDNPLGLAIDANGTLFISDAYNHVLRQITPLGIVTTLRASGTVLAGLPSPAGVAVDRNGNIYFADNNNSVVRRLGANGGVSTFAGSGAPGTSDGTGSAASFVNPLGVAVDKSGNVFVADVGAIRKITPAGVVTKIAGTAFAVGSSDGVGSNATFDNPPGLAIDALGNIYVADALNNKVRKIAAR